MLDHIIMAPDDMSDSLITFSCDEYDKIEIGSNLSVIEISGEYELNIPYTCSIWT